MTMNEKVDIQVGDVVRMLDLLAIQSSDDLFIAGCLGIVMDVTDEGRAVIRDHAGHFSSYNTIMLERI